VFWDAALRRSTFFLALGLSIAALVGAYAQARCAVGGAVAGQLPCRPAELLTHQQEGIFRHKNVNYQVMSAHPSCAFSKALKARIRHRRQRMRESLAHSMMTRLAPLTPASPVRRVPGFRYG